MNQQEQIKLAKRAYVFPLSNCRYSVYLMTEEKLSLLWPEEGERLLPFQVRTWSKRYPKYHFWLRGHGYSKLGEITQIIKEVNPDCRVALISGFALA